MACCIETAELARVRTMCLTKRTLRMNMTKKRKKNYLTDYLYILPAAAFVGIFFVSSILYTFYLSFFEWDGFSEKIFVEEAIPSCSLKKEGSRRVKEAGERSFFSVESNRNVPTDLMFSFVIPND